MAKKKKMSGKVKTFNIVLICLLSVFIIALSIVLVTMIYRNKEFYKAESREKQIEKNKAKDNDDQYSTIGWVRVQGTNIDYPLYGVDKESEDFPVTKSLLWSLNMDRDYHNVMILYGHNIMNLSANPIRKDKSFIRLEELMQYVYFDFAKNNKYFQVSYGGEEYMYKIFAVDFMNLVDINAQPYGEFVKKDRDDYLKLVNKKSIYDYDVDVNDDDKIASIVTCTRFFGDKNYYFLITGRLVREDEKLENYNVKRNKNYSNVAYAMKGKLDQIDDEYKADAEGEDEYEFNN